MTNSNIILEVKNVTKKFQISPESLRLLFYPNSPNIKYYTALKDISFNLKVGETLGIIGRNGAGKSTLVKIIMGTLVPSSGHVKAYGEVKGVTEVSSGISITMTGRENILYNFKLLGINNKDAIDEMIEFLDLDDFLDLPVKSYSTGMKAKLGFALSLYSYPKVLLLDEVLAVGDFVFQQKCFEKINKIKKTSAVILVTHSLNALVTFCDRALVLEKGFLAFDGKVSSAIEYFLTNDPALSSSKKLKPAITHIGNFVEPNDIYDISVNINSDKFEFKDMISISYSFKLKKIANNLIIGIPIFNEYGSHITSINSDAINVLEKNSISHKGIINFPSSFLTGKYYIVLAIHDGPFYFYRQLLKEINISNSIREHGKFIQVVDWNIE